MQFRRARVLHQFAPWILQYFLVVWHLCAPWVGALASLQLPSLGDRALQPPHHCQRCSFLAQNLPSSNSGSLLHLPWAPGQPRKADLGDQSATVLHKWGRRASSPLVYEEEPPLIISLALDLYTYTHCGLQQVTSGRPRNGAVSLTFRAPKRAPTSHSTLKPNIFEALGWSACQCASRPSVRLISHATDQSRDRETTLTLRKRL